MKARVTKVCISKEQYTRSVDPCGHEDTINDNTGLLTDGIVADADDQEDVERPDNNVHNCNSHRNAFSDSITTKHGIRVVFTKRLVSSVLALFVIHECTVRFELLAEALVDTSSICCQSERLVSRGEVEVLRKDLVVVVKLLINIVAIKCWREFFLHSDGELLEPSEEDEHEG